MLSAQRHQRIVALLREERFCSLGRIVRELDVSPATVRRDLNILQQQGILRRTHGGVVFLGEKNGLPLFLDRQSTLATEKAAIGQRAAALVDDGDTVIIDGGTTPYQVAVHLQDRAIQVVTNSLPVANLFADSHQVQLISTGGTLYPGTGVYLGPYAENALRHIRAQKAFIGVAGISREGFYNSNALVVETEKRILEAAAEVYVVADHTKFGRTGLAFLCDFSAVRAVVTNATPAARSAGRKILAHSKLKVYIAG